MHVEGKEHPRLGAMLNEDFCVGPAISKCSYFWTAVYNVVMYAYSSICCSCIMLCDCICRYIIGFVLYYDAVAGFHHDGSITTTSVVILMWAGIVI
jgi:hypothetical protein